MEPTDAPTIRVAPILRTILLLAAIHSFATGVGLIVQPVPILEWAGWGTIEQHFFPAQGGVFHILMALLYMLAYRSVSVRGMLMPFIILVKTVAAVFLLLYYTAVEPIWMVLASAVIDGLFAAVFLYLFLRSRSPVPRI